MVNFDEFRCSVVHSRECNVGVGPDIRWGGGHWYHGLRVSFLSGAQLTNPIL